MPASLAGIDSRGSWPPEISIPFSDTAWTVKTEHSVSGFWVNAIHPMNEVRSGERELLFTLFSFDDEGVAKISRMHFRTADAPPWSVFHVFSPEILS